MCGYKEYRVEHGNDIFFYIFLIFFTIIQARCWTGAESQKNSQRYGMENEISILEENSIRSKIQLIRGQQVMLDFDLAEIYGYSTKAFNQQVKNNIERFDDDFRFQLNESEVEALSRSKNLTLNKGSGSNIQYAPYAFTE